MLMMITLHHAHTGDELYVFRSKILGFTYSSTQKCTFLYSDAGAVVPVRESIDYLKEHISVNTLSERTSE